ncbi:MAG: collagen binding domain-containing protein [Candidatus Dormibacteria bacterium]
MGLRQSVVGTHRGSAATARLLVAGLVGASLQAAVSSPVQARTVPTYPVAKGLGPAPEHSITGDCRDPTPDPGALCINTPWNGHISISPHIVTACKQQGGQLVGDCRITASIVTDKYTVVWGGAGKQTLAGFTDCSGQATPDSDVPGGYRGGPTSCSEQVTTPTNGWVVATQAIAGPCASVHAFQQGSGEFATCTTASGATAASDYYAVLPADTGVIMGHVYQKDGTTPLRGMAVQIRSSDNKRSVAYTDATGFYSAYVDNGSYTVCPCWFENNMFNQGQADVFTPRSPTLSVSGPVTQDFVEGGWQVAGHFTRKVTRKDDPPLAGVTVAVTGQDGYFRETQTDANGHYSITVPDGSYAIEGLTPPPPQNNEYVDGVPYQCVLNGARSPTAQCVLIVTADQPHVDFLFNNQYDLSVKEGSSSPGQGVRTITAHVTDTAGDPVAGAKVHFTASAPGGAPVLLQAASGGGPLFTALGQTAAAVGATAQATFELTTDWSGAVELVKWSGDWSPLTLNAAIDDGSNGTLDLSSAPSENAQLQDSSTAPPQAPPLSSGLPSTLNKSILSRNRARPATGSPPAALQFVVMDALNDLASTSGAGYVPVTSSDGTRGGIVLFPQNSSTQSVNALVAYLATPTASPAPAVQGAEVVDMSAVAAVVDDPGSNGILPATFEPLSSWAQANPGMTPGMMDGNDSGGVSSGYLYTHGIEPPAVADRQRNDGVLGLQATGMVVVTRGPVALMAVLQGGAAAGESAGIDPSGQVVTGIPGAEVLDYSRMAISLRSGLGAMARGKPVTAYVLPTNLGDYSFTLTGTGSGPASVEFLDQNGNATASFSVAASRGAVGTIATLNGSPGSTLTFQGRTVQPDNGPQLRLLGMPSHLVPGVPQTLTLRVLDSAGMPVPGAKVEVKGSAPSAPASDAVAWAAADGTASLLLEVPEAPVYTAGSEAGSAALPAFPPARTAYSMTATASAPGYTSATITPTSGAVPAGGSAQASAEVASLPGPPSPWAQIVQLPFLIGIIVVAAVLLACVGVVRLRWSVVKAAQL